MRSRSTILLILVLSCVATTLHAQQPANQPIDLPEFIVTGKERIEVPSSAKQPPAKPLSLKAQILDSLNPTEKHPMPKLPAHALPNPIRTFTMWPGFVEASLGNYITPRVVAGYSLKAGGYRIDLLGSAEGAIDAWAPNAEYMKANIDVLSTYTAPPEFLFFAGSVTEVDLAFKTNAYKLYALSDAPKRNTSSLLASVNVDGEYEGFNYDGGASFASRTMVTDATLASPVITSSDVSDNTLRGYLTLEQKWEKYDVGARLDLRFSSFAGNAYPFMEGNVFARYSNTLLRLSGGVGLQSATSTTNASHFGLLLLGNLDLFLADALTLQADFRSGLRQVTFTDLLDENPYVSASTTLDAAYDVFDIHSAVVLRPSLSLAATVGVRIRQTDRQPVWIGDSTRTFAPMYASATMLQIPADVRWILTARDVLSADFTFTAASIDSVVQPYVPAVKASLSYERDWTPTIRSVIGAVYIGDRYADMANQITLSGYVDVRLRAEMDLSPAFSMHVRAENLMANAIVLWNGYAERGAFFSGGITWKF